MASGRDEAAERPVEAFSLRPALAGERWSAVNVRSTFCSFARRRRRSFLEFVFLSAAVQRLVTGSQFRISGLPVVNSAAAGPIVGAGVCGLFWFAAAAAAAAMISTVRELQRALSARDAEVRDRDALIAQLRAELDKCHQVLKPMVQQLGTSLQVVRNDERIGRFIFSLVGAPISRKATGRSFAPIGAFSRI